MNERFTGSICRKLVSIAGFYIGGGFVIEGIVSDIVYAESKRSDWWFYSYTQEYLAAGIGDPAYGPWGVTGEGTGYRGSRYRAAIFIDNRYIGFAGMV